MDYVLHVYWSVLQIKLNCYSHITIRGLSDARVKVRSSSRKKSNSEMNVFVRKEYAFVGATGNSKTF